MKAEDLCRLLPHAGRMCLLDTLVSWSPERIVCETSSHRQPDNPLRRDGRLATVNAIEYAAQAMGIHGGLEARERGEKVTGGYLGGLRDVKMTQTDLSACDGPLRIEAERLLAQPGGSIYRFAVYCGADCLIAGQATVILQTATE